MRSAQEKLQFLLTEGGNFDYDNFSTKTENGYVRAFVPDWLTWKTRVSGAILALFGQGSAPFRLIQAGDAVRLIGNGPAKYEQAMSHYLSALRTAIEVIEKDTFGELLTEAKAKASQAFSNKVFVVHGHDESAKQELEIILAEMGLEPVVLHRQPDGGRTLIEKFEHYADVGYAFIIMTPDEVAYLASDAEKPDPERNKEARARPNVVFEFGFFVGRLSRARTCCLIRGDVSKPSDLDGLVYKRFEKKVEEVAYAIQRELKAAGYKVR